MSSTIKSAPGSEERLRDPEALDLRLVVVRRVVVPHSDPRVAERTGRYELESVAHEELRARKAEPLEILLDLLDARVAKLEAVDADEPLVLVPQHRCDETRTVVDADLHVRLLGLEAGSGEIEKREDVLGGEVLDLQDRREAAVARMLRAREVVE